MEQASHMHLFSFFGLTSMAAPCYWQLLAWRALRFRNKQKFTFFELLLWALNDAGQGQPVFSAHAGGAVWPMGACRGDGGVPRSCLGFLAMRLPALPL